MSLFYLPVLNIGSIKGLKLIGGFITWLTCTDY